MKKYFGFLILGLGIFLLPMLSHASGTYLQPSNPDIIAPTSTGMATMVVRLKGGTTVSPANYFEFDATPQTFLSDITDYTENTVAVIYNCASDYSGCTLLTHVPVTTSTSALDPTHINVKITLASPITLSTDYFAAIVAYISVNSSTGLTSGLGNFYGDYSILSDTVQQNNVSGFATTVGGGETNFNALAMSINTPLVSGSAPTPSMSFVKPIDGSSTILFDNFILKGSNLTSTDQYTIYQEWQIPINQSHFQNSQTFTGAQLANGVLMPFTGFPNVCPNGNVCSFVGIPVSSQAYLFDNATDPNSLNYIASTSISFQIDPQGNTTSTTSVLLHNFVSPTGTVSQTTSTVNNNPFISTGKNISSFCPSPQDITDIGGGIYYAACATFSFIFNPNTIPQSVSFLSDALNNIKTVPPFSPFFVLANEASGTLGGIAPTSTGVSIGIRGFDNENVNLVTLNSSTFYGGFGNATSGTATASHNTMNFLTTYIGTWLWIGAGIKLIYVFAFA
jgi:hypothetical protein